MSAREAGDSKLRARRTQDRRASLVRVSQASPSAYWGMQEDVARWHAIYALYSNDNLEGAAALVEESSVGVRGQHLPFLQILEAEWATQSQGERRRLSPWLEIEFVPEETGDGIDELAKVALAACQMVGNRLDWQHEVPVRLSLLAEEPGSGYRLGYEVPKYPYEKICISPTTIHDGSFASVVAHEYGHVASENMSASTIPTWVTEGVSIWVANQLQSPRPFVDGSWLWRDPSALEQVFATTWSPVRGELNDRWVAYQQAGQIVAHLASRGGEASIARFLRAHAMNSWYRVFQTSILGQRPTQIALREVYKQDEPSVFRSARELLASLG